jgi:IS5 family transposase
MGEEKLAALLQESLSVAHKTGALSTKDLERVAVDTTVQPKAVAHPTDARLMHRALEESPEHTSSPDELKSLQIGPRSNLPLRA